MHVNLEARAAAAEQRRNRTRARLLDAAMRVVAEKGAPGLSVSDVAAAAGLSRGAFYNYFPTPDDLMIAVTEKMTSDVLDELRVELAGVEDPAEWLAAGCLKFIEKCLKDPLWGWARLRLDGTGAPPPAPVVEHFTQLYRQGVQAGRFTPGSVTAALSLALGSLRMVVRLRLTTGLDAKADVGAETITLVLTGLGLPRPEAQAILFRIGERQARTQSQDAPSLDNA